MTAMASAFDVQAWYVQADYVLIDHGYTEDWGALCYPPLTD